VGGDAPPRPFGELTMEAPGDTGGLYPKAQALAAEGLSRKAVQERLIAEGADPEAAQVVASAVVPPDAVSFSTDEDERVVLTDYLRPRMQANTAISFGLFFLVAGLACILWWGFGPGGPATVVAGGLCLVLGTVMGTLGLALFRAREQQRRRPPPPAPEP
jgi:hypothetical protein